MLWSAKSGSKAVTYWFLSRQNLIEQADAFPGKPHLFRSQVVRKMSRHNDWLASCDPLTLNWLRVIRDPYRRAVSSYRQALGHGYEDGRIEELTRLLVKDNGLSFTEFLDYLLVIDVSACNKHHAEQWHPIEEHVTLRKVINIDKESLMEALESFEREIGLEPLAPHVRARMFEEWERDSKRFHKRLEVDAGVHADTRFTRDEAVGAWPGYEAFLSSETRRKIEQIYAKDFAAYATVL